MIECIEYKKYFHDYVDEVLSPLKQSDYQVHIDRCSFCTKILHRNERYREQLNAIAPPAELPSGTDLRFKGRLRFIQQKEPDLIETSTSAAGVSRWLRDEADETASAAKMAILMGKTYFLDRYGAHLDSN